MPILGQKYRHIDMSGLLIGHNRTAKVRIYLLIIKCFRKKLILKIAVLFKKTETHCCISVLECYCQVFASCIAYCFMSLTGTIL